MDKREGPRGSHIPLTNAASKPCKITTNRLFTLRAALQAVDRSWPFLDDNTPELRGVPAVSCDPFHDDGLSSPYTKHWLLTRPIRGALLPEDRHVPSPTIAGNNGGMAETFWVSNGESPTSESDSKLGNGCSCLNILLMVGAVNGLSQRRPRPLLLPLQSMEKNSWDVNELCQLDHV